MTTTDRDETFTLMHRSKFFGTPDNDPVLGRVNRWEYRGFRWSVTRPADGEPPRPVTVRCSECDEPVEMLVRSHSGTRRIRAMFRWAAVGFAVLAVLAVVLTGTAIGIADDPSVSEQEEEQAEVMVVMGVLLVMAAVTVAWTLVLKAANQIGVSGGGAGSAVFAKHLVSRAQQAPDARPLP